MNNSPADFDSIIEVIRRQYPEKKNIILHEPVFLGNEKGYLNECIDTTFVSYVGRFVDEFEKAICDVTGAPYAIAVVNGTSALMLALIASGVGQEDEVITQSLTFVATAAAIRHTGAWPVFLDVEEESLGLCPKALSKFLHTDTERTPSGLINKMTGRPIKAILPVHIFGNPAKTEEIVSLADDFKLPVIEDAAEAMGSFSKGEHVGIDGKAGILSFNGNKIITTGGGGAIITKDADFAARLKHLSTTAKKPHSWEFIHDEVGYNLRMPNTSAAIGVAQLECLDRILANKSRLSENYRRELQTLGVKMLGEPSESTPNKWLNNIVFDNRAERDAFLEYSNKRGVHCRPVWTLLHELEPYRKCHREQMSQSMYWADRLVSIPSGYSTFLAGDTSNE